MFHCTGSFPSWSWLIVTKSLVKHHQAFAKREQKYSSKTGRLQSRRTSFVFFSLKLLRFQVPRIPWIPNFRLQVCSSPPCKLHPEARGYFLLVTTYCILFLISCNNSHMSSYPCNYAGLHDSLFEKNRRYSLQFFEPTDYQHQADSIVVIRMVVAIPQFYLK